MIVMNWKDQLYEYENQKKWIIYYRKNGYSVLDLAEFRTNSKKGNLDRGED